MKPIFGFHDLATNWAAQKPASPARPNRILSGRAARYLLYAIGEIALVVIGILIALQINNWNEYRKERTAESIALQSLQTELSRTKKVFKQTYPGR